MKIIPTIIFILKYSLLGVFIGSLILFFMPQSQLDFNWHNVKNAWQFYLAQSKQKQNHSNKPFNIEDISFAQAVDKASPSVVSLNVYRPKGLRNSALLGPNEKILDVTVGIGSGIILSTDGYIATNYHVVSGASKISVNFYDDKRRIAELIDYDEKIDIAILKTQLSGLSPAVLGDSEKVKVGDIVMAIGSPFALNMSVSLGIVSAWTDTRSGDKFIQTDASINTGNSGGALINNRGEVIGINRSALSYKDGAQTGISHAIPINEVNQIFADIIQFGYIKKNWLGITTGELEIKHHLEHNADLLYSKGFFVAKVDKDSPAEQAGIQVGDFINGYQGVDLDGVSAFYQLFRVTPIGAKVELRLIRDGQVLTKQVQLLEMPKKIHSAVAATAPENS